MTELGKTWERDDLGAGRFRLIQNLKPITFRKNGSPARIVSNFIDGDVNFPNVINEAGFFSYITPQGDWKVHPTRDPNVWWKIGAPYVNPAAPVRATLNPFTRSGNTLTSVNTNFDCRIIHGGHFLKLEFPLKNGFVPPQSKVAFLIDSQGITRVGTELRVGGVPIMTLTPPVVYDAANPLDVRPIAVALQSVSGTLYVIYTLPDLAGMSAPVIDPTLTQQPDGTAGTDTFVNEASANGNNAAINPLVVRSTAGNRRHSLIKFDLSPIPGSATISSGELDLWNVGQFTATVTLARILAANSAWTELGATWNHAVASTTRWAGDTGLDGGTDAGCSVSGADYSATDMGAFATLSSDAVGTKYAVTLSVAELQAMLVSNSGIHARTTSISNQSFESSDSVTATNRPQQLVVYTLPAASSGVLSWRPNRRGYDFDGGYHKCQYLFGVGN